MPITGLKSSYAADFYYKRSEIYLVDNILDKVFKVNTDGTGFEAIIETGLDNPQGIALDWTANNLYIVDSGRDIIEVRNSILKNYFNAIFHSTIHSFIQYI